MFGAQHKNLTLGELWRTGRVVYCLCCSCRHQNNLSAKMLMERTSADTKVTHVANLLRCSRCGSKKVWTEPGERPKHPYRTPPAVER